MDEWVEIGDAKEIPEGKSRVIQLRGETIALFNLGGEVCAISNVCPHEGGPLGEGNLEGDVVVCPWHEWRYNVRTGRPVMTPSVRTYDVRRDGDTLYVAVAGGQPSRLTEETPVVQNDPVYDILEEINLGTTLDEVFEKIYVQLQPIVPHNRLGLALIDPASGKLVQVKTKSDRRILLDNGFSARISGSSLSRLLDSGEARIIDDLHRHLAEKPSLWTRLIVQEGMRSSLTLPLKVRGKPIGVVFFTSVEPAAFSETHVGFLKQIVGQLSILIEKGRWVSELAQSHERYRVLFEMSNDAIFVCKFPTFVFVTANEHFAEWLGYTHAELSNLALKDLMREEEFRRVNPTLERLAPGGTPALFEVELKKPDGGTLPLEIRAVAMERTGETFLQGFARDLSELRALSEQLRSHQSFEGLVGKNRRMQEIYELIQQVAPMSTTVLIQGESGTGKELVARAIHHHSRRAKKPFVAVNCGALSENLLESELFGHVKGAFTGAVAPRKGRFELADGGTIFLDEIGDLSPAMQVKLLRVLQEGEFEPVGSSTTRRGDVRVLAATNRDLRAAIREARFREDLFYRLNVVPIPLPPLRERREDIPPLVRHFIEKFNRQTNKSIQNVSPEAMEILLEYPYPGNVRELENLIEHAFVKCPGGVIEKRHLPADLTAPGDDIVRMALAADNPLAVLERELARRVLEQSGGSPSLAAKRLGVSRTTLWRKLNRLG